MKKALFLCVFFFFAISSVSLDAKEGENISEAEKKILDELFSQRQEIKNLQEQTADLKKDIREGEEKKSDLSKALEVSKLKFDEHSKSLSEVLRGFQKRGGANLFRLFLDSENLSEMLFRLNIFREFSKSTSEMLKELKREQIDIVNQKNEIERTLEDIKKKKREVDDKMVQLEKAIAKNEEALSALREDREKYESTLEELEEKLNALEETLKLFTVEFNKLLSSGYFPDEMINISVSLKGVSGTLKDREMNKLLEKYDVPRVKMIFKKNSVVLTSEEYQLSLEGMFVVESGEKMRFKGTRGSFFGLTLTGETISEMSKKNYLLFDFTPILEGYRMKSVETDKGIMTIYLKIF